MGEGRGEASEDLFLFEFELLVFGHGFLDPLAARA